MGRLTTTVLLALAAWLPVAGCANQRGDAGIGGPARADPVAPPTAPAPPEPATAVPVPIPTSPPKPTTSAPPAGPRAGHPAPPVTTTPATAGAATGACEVPAGYPEPWPDRPRYTAHLAVDPARRAVTGDLAVRFTPDAATDRLVFRLWPNAPRLGRAGGRLEITAATLGAGGPAGPSGHYEAGGALVGRPGTIWIMPGQFAAGVPAEARLTFRLTVPGAVNDRVATAGKAVRLGSVLPILSWVRGEGWQTSPAVAANAEAAATEVADWDVTVTGPAGYSILATGDEVAPGSGPSASPEASTTRVVARAVRDWAATVAPMRIGRASAQGGATEVVVGVAEGSGGDPGALAARHARALDALAARFGPYPYARLTIGVTSGLSGGIEFPTHIFLGAGVANVHLVHEVAHQWFYGLAGNDQYRHPWLDEALATYAESRVDGALASQRRRAVPSAGRGHLGESMAYWSRLDGRSYYLSVYIGGLQALAAVADRTGGYPALDCALRHYVHARAYTLSRPQDLLAALRAGTGLDPAPALAPFGIR